MAPSTSIRKAYADSPLGQIHYRYTVPLQLPADISRLPILFLHMSASSSVCFEALMQTYTLLGHPCFAPDMPGFGASFNPSTDPPDIKWYIDLYITTFLNSPTFPVFQKGCHIFGHHSGGCIAVELAATHPHLVKSLAVAGPVLLDSTRREAARSATQAFNQPVADGSHLQKTWDYLISHGNINPQAELNIIQQETLNHLRAWNGRLQIYGCVFGPASDGPSLYKKVQCPLITFCAKDDVLYKDWEAKMGVLRPDCEMIVVEGGNFEPSRDPSGVERGYSPFLEAAEGRDVR